MEIQTNEFLRDGQNGPDHLFDANLVRLLYLFFSGIGTAVPNRLSHSVGGWTGRFHRSDFFQQMVAQPFSVWAYRVAMEKSYLFQGTVDGQII